MLVIYWIMSGALIAIDQWVKWWITSNLALGETQSIIPGVLSLNHIRNTGAAWSMLEGKMWFFTVVTIVAVVAIVYLMIKNRQTASRWFMTGLALILAGAIGNFIDRVRLGYVVDMFQTDFMNFPIFNVADISLVCGVICILIYIILDEKDQVKK
ncbi:lipoprotein signal peptidase [Enterococcus thailandicus]|uniref:signal peptidase II n=1 Tax=Enterococcus TaxID=1350 RepID=UPI000A33EC40|nr:MULTISPECIES: signal peptidase II [Enterococcus]ASZ07680.1 signal peptidase II [Enterococcus thailandicus]MDA3965679.1 signal peptidase II [Enterococcus thailandicus]MDK4350972.1 signal peptidase II [Enterococcus thailandicus]MDT2733374.1 signal peptidase II [Enterococcus thailandicus]MDT2750628.1 signal peptidase II [Enterococcus thailandicus]